MAIIVRLFCQLILLSCIFVQYSSTMNETNYILCTARCSQFTVSFTDPTAIPQQCQEDNSEGSIYDNALTCGITYRIDYVRQQVEVELTANNETSDSDESKSRESLTQTVQWNFHDDSRYDSGEISRTYTCSVSKDCAREFYLKTIAALANNGRDKLDAIKEKLYNRTAIIGDSSRRRCTDNRKTGNKTSVKCGHGLCHARVETYELDEEKNSKTQRCEHAQRSYLRSEIEQHAPKSTRNRAVLEFVCNKNVCNRNDLIPKIQTLLQEYAQWNPVEQDESAPAADADAVPADVTQKSALGLAMKQTLSSSLLLSFVILIRFFI